MAGGGRGKANVSSLCYNITITAATPKFTLHNLDTAVLSKVATIHFQYSVRQYCYRDGDEKQFVNIPNSVF